MSNSTRRDFLALAALLASSAAARSHRLSATGLLEKKPQIWTTAGSSRMKAEELAWTHAASPANSAVLHLDKAERRQRILGFGAALTDAACIVLNEMPAEARAKLLAEVYGPSGMRFSAGRICVGSSDYSASVYSYDDTEKPDPELKHFSIAHDRSNILPILREARQLNPDLYLLASPWSPPGWMKAGGSMLGGSMRKSFFAAYANYLSKFLAAYSAEGVPVQSLTVQNEADTDQDGRMPAALWGQEYEVEFVKSHLGPELAKSSPATKIWILDHNYNLYGRAINELEDPDLAKYVDGVAWHGYSGTPEAMSKVHAFAPGKHMYWTEGGPETPTPDYATNWTHWGAKFCGILNNWSESILAWNLALDEHGKPNVGPFDCRGVLTVDAKSKQVTYSGMYWALGHLSRFVRPGARVLAPGATATAAESVATVGFENPDGGRVLFVANNGGEQKLRIRDEKGSLDLKLEADSISTVVW